MIHFTSDNLNRYIAFKLGVERLNFDIFELSKLKELEIDPCADNLEKLSTKKLTTLILNNTYINNMDKLNNFKFLNKLSLIDMKKVDILFLKDLPNLSSLTLTNSKVERENILSIFNLIEYLAIDNTDIKDISFLNDMMKLKVLIIDNNLYDNNKKLINSLIKRNVCVLENGIHNLSYKEFEV